MIVGGNAGGKSNFVRSLSYQQDFFKEADKAKSYKNMIHTKIMLVFVQRRAILYSRTIKTVKVFGEGNTEYNYITYTATLSQNRLYIILSNFLNKGRDFVPKACYDIHIRGKGSRKS